MLGLARQTPSWQLILADLALILFLMTAAALSADRGMEKAAQTPSASATQPSSVLVGPAHALYRPGSDMPSFAQWLESQPRDPRASLTVIAEHSVGGEEAAWRDARAMAATARALNVRARVIIREGEENAVQASLGYDQPGL